jgi:PEP-CTERM motif
VIAKTKQNKTKERKKTMKTIQTLKTLALIGLLSQIPSAKAASVFFDSSTFGIKNAAGGQLSNTADNLVAIGYFADGFTATSANYSSWLSNFKGVAGYHKLTTGTQSLGFGLNTVSAGITVIPVAGPDNSPEDGINDYKASVGSIQGGAFLGGLLAGDFLPESKSFSLVIWNAATSAGATQAGVFTGTSAWQITTQFDVAAPDLTDFSLPATSFTAVVGSSSTTTGNRFFQLSTIPEPSSASLLALGMAGLVALRARRKS